MPILFMDMQLLLLTSIPWTLYHSIVCFITAGDLGIHHCTLYEAVGWFSIRETWQTVLPVYLQSSYWQTTIFTLHFFWADQMVVTWSDDCLKLNVLAYLSHWRCPHRWYYSRGNYTRRHWSHAGRSLSHRGHSHWREMRWYAWWSHLDKATGTEKGK